jgi:hypothetical protein
MTPDSPQAIDLKSTLDKLVHAASNQDFTMLDTIYHQNMRIYLLEGSDALHQMDKAGFKKHVIESTQSAQKPNIWAKYHLVEANETQGHIIISRKVNLTGSEQIVTLSIDFVFEDDRWQITREVIFT